MSDYEEHRLLSRRERRLRDMAATGAMPLVATTPETGAGEAAGAPGTDEIVISPVDDQGRPRTRREMRELREQALAERAAQAEQPVDGEPLSREEVPAEAAAPDAVDSEPSADVSLTQTQPFTREDLAAATAAAGATESAAEPVPDSTPAAASIFVTAPATSPAAVPAEEPTFAEPASVSDAAAELSGDVDLDGDGDLDDEIEGALEPDTVPVAAVRPDPAPVSAPTQAYTFPDIAPLDEGISVFDDPASRTTSQTGSDIDPGEDADFDSFISRAVAQEGAASASSSSALILPTMPESADLAGPLGETGELYITGSIELPRSLGETGGHAALLDSVEADPLDELGISDRPASESGIAPVSATRAVSARATLGPVVTESQKEKSKLPVVLIATGGGLVVAVVALLIWGATSGMFG